MTRLGEIGTRLFLSPRTVQFHLRKVIIKLAITYAPSSAASYPAAEAPDRRRNPRVSRLIASGT